jgi:hypothetical protein
VRVNKQEVVLTQLRFSYRPLRGRFSLSGVVHSDNDHPAMCLLMLSLSSPASMNVNIGVPSDDKTMIVRTVGPRS